MSIEHAMSIFLTSGVSSIIIWVKKYFPSYIWFVKYLPRYGNFIKNLYYLHYNLLNEKFIAQFSSTNQRSLYFFFQVQFRKQNTQRHFPSHSPTSPGGPTRRITARTLSHLPRPEEKRDAVAAVRIRFLLLLHCVPSEGSGGQSLPRHKVSRKRRSTH